MTRRRVLRDVRTRLLAIVLATLAIGFFAAVIGFAFLLTRTTDADANKVLRARAAAELALVRVHQGAITLQAPTSGAVSDSSVWVFDGNTPIQSARADARTQAAVQSLVGSNERLVNVDGNDVRLYAQPIMHGSASVGTLVTAISLDPYEAHAQPRPSRRRSSSSSACSRSSALRSGGSFARRCVRSRR